MVEIKLRALKDAKLYEFLVRFGFGGACTALAGFIAHRYGPVIGGLFLAFPAIFPASVSLVESHERARKRQIGVDGTQRGRMAAANDAAGAALGCAGLMLFATVVWKLLPQHNAVLVIALAGGVWLIATLLLWEVRKRRLFGRSRRRTKVPNH